jgi:AcrR family transcriptional regulator
VPEPSIAKLPRGRHGLSREEVESSQRLRILLGMAEAMREQGYVDTTVADVLTRAGVSRESFYRLFTSKADCFAAAFDEAAAVLLERIAGATAGRGAGDDEPPRPADPLDAAEPAITAYLEALAAEPAWARLFLVEVHAAGPDAMSRRFAIQDRFVDALADLLGARTERQRFAAQVVVSAMSAMVTRPLVDGDVEGLRALGPPMVAHLRAIWPAVGG